MGSVGVRRHMERGNELALQEIKSGSAKVEEGGHGGGFTSEVVTA